MPKFAANLTMLFTELPFLDRFERAASAGPLPSGPAPPRGWQRYAAAGGCHA